MFREKHIFRKQFRNGTRILELNKKINLWYKFRKNALYYFSDFFPILFKEAKINVRGFHNC